MAKGKSTIFFCQNCGYESSKWMGQCPGCREWNTMVEETVVTAGKGKSTKTAHEKAVPASFSEISLEKEERDVYKRQFPNLVTSLLPKCA